MNKNNRIIVIILAVLFITTTIGVIVNQRYAADRKALLEATEIAVRESGQEVARLNMTVSGFDENRGVYCPAKEQPNGKTERAYLYRHRFC